MSNSQSYSYSSSSFSSSSYSGGRPGEHHAQRYTESSTSDSDRGTTTTRCYEETGKPTIEETTSIPANAGRRVEDSGEGAQGRIEDVSEREEQAQRNREYEDRMEEEQAQRNREYEDRMEEEYAKREGGA